MNAEAIMTVCAAVVALTQLAKWSGVDGKHAPLLVLALSLGGVGLWAFTQDFSLRSDAFSYFAGWIAVATSAAGVFGFTRATRDALADVSAATGTRPPQPE